MINNRQPRLWPDNIASKIKEGIDLESNITGKRDVEPKIMSSAFAISYGKRERKVGKELKHLICASGANVRNGRYRARELTLG